jgi:hypothetical protein
LTAELVAEKKRKKTLIRDIDEIFGKGHRIILNCVINYAMRSMKLIQRVRDAKVIQRVRDAKGEYEACVDEKISAKCN